MWMMALHWLTDTTTKRAVSQPHESLFIHYTTTKSYRLSQADTFKAGLEFDRTRA